MQDDTLKIKVFQMKQVTLGDEFKVTKDSLVIKEQYDFQGKDLDEMTIRLLAPGKYDRNSDTIMDVIPISTKVLGTVGNGVTHTLTGVQVVLCGAIKEGEQLHEFGSTEGILADHLIFDRPGTPSKKDYIILIDALAKKETVFTRQVCLEIFAAADDYVQEIREALKMLDGREAVENYVYENNPRSGKTKVAIVKQVAGQGAMYDTMLFPKEPSGFAGGLSIIDINNMPVVLTPNEYRDGAVRAMD